MPCFCGCYASLFSAPRHHYGIGGQLPFQNFIPPNQYSAIAVEKTLYALREISLQFCHCLQSLLLHTLLTTWTSAPRLTRGFITTNMDVTRGKYLHHLAQHVVEKNKSLLVANTEIAISLFHLLTLQFWIGIQHLRTMTGHLDFGNHRDVTCCSISHYFLQILLGVISTRCTDIVFACIALPLFAPFIPISPYSPSRLFSQSGILQDFHAPSSIISEMQMQLIHLEISHSVQLLQDKLLRPKMARAVEHKSSVGIPGFVLDNAAGHTTLLF